MNERSTLDQAFIDRQRLRLLALRAALLAAASDAAAEVGSLHQESRGQAAEREDDAQNLALLETRGILDQQGSAQLALVDRALEKIRDGTYGLDDRSGRPIAVERLEALPEAASALPET